MDPLPYLADRRAQRSAAAGRWPGAAWIAGDGPWAVVARCRATTVTLHPTAAAARRSLEMVDRFACGAGCTGATGHAVETLEPAAVS